MRRFVLFLFPALIAFVSAGLLVAAQRSETFRAQIARLKERDWITPILPSTPEISEVPS